MKNFTLAVLTATFVATGAFAQTSADKNILPVKTKALLEKFEKNMHAVKTMPATTKTMRPNVPMRLLYGNHSTTSSTRTMRVGIRMQRTIIPTMYKVLY